MKFALRRDATNNLLTRVRGKKKWCVEAWLSFLSLPNLSIRPADPEGGVRARRRRFLHESSSRVPPAAEAHPEERTSAGREHRRHFRRARLLRFALRLRSRHLRALFNTNSPQCVL